MYETKNFLVIYFQLFNNDLYECIFADRDRLRKRYTEQNIVEQAGVIEYLGLDNKLL